MLQHRSPLRTFGLGVTLGVALLGTACGTVSGPQQAALDPAGLPDYRAGQSFTFSDRRTRRVVATEGGAVRWSSEPGTSYLVSPNFIVPILRRETSSRVVSHHVFGSPDDLWPLRVGKSVRFRVARTTLSKSDDSQTSTIYNWQCNVAGRNGVTVPAGTFDTYRIDCRRFFGPRQTPRRRITWYYAPKLGHYVRREKEHLGSHEIRTIELVSTSGRSGAEVRPTAPSKPRETAQSLPKPAPDRYAVHLASYRDAASAQQGWSELRARFPVLLAGKQLTLERADLGERGVHQRVLAVPFGSRAAAEDLCSRINAKAPTQYCLVTMG